MNSLSIAVVDDHPVLLEGVAELIGREFGAPVVAVGGEASDIGSIVDAYSPDAMIVDLSMPGDVYGQIAIAAKSAPRLKIIVYTASHSPHDALRAFDAGACGFVLKDSSADELVEAINATVRGQGFVSPAFAPLLVNILASRATAQRDTSKVQFSVRETQIIRLLLSGKKNQEIGKALSLSEKTIKGYMTHLMYKLNVRTRLEVILAAQRINPSEFGSGTTGDALN